MTGDLGKDEISSHGVQALTAPKAVTIGAHSLLTEAMAVHVSIPDHSYHRLSLIINNASQINLWDSSFKDFADDEQMQEEEKPAGKDDVVILNLRSIATNRSKQALVCDSILQPRR